MESKSIQVLSSGFDTWFVDKYFWNPNEKWRANM